VHASTVDATWPAVAQQQEEQSTSASTQPTLRDSESQTVVRVLAECGGNVSVAARTRGVSRGRIYRHLRRQA
jgi:transcriptional regulator of acetoin/glycerol metabolism